MNTKNIKTTLSGVITAVASFIILNEQFKDFPIHYRVASFLMSGGLASLGILARDADEN